MTDKKDAPILSKDESSTVTIFFIFLFFIVVITVIIILFNNELLGIINPQNDEGVHENNRDNSYIVIENDKVFISPGYICEKDSECSIKAPECKTFQNEKFKRCSVRNHDFKTLNGSSINKLCNEITINNTKIKLVEEEGICKIPNEGYCNNNNDCVNNNCSNIKNSNLKICKQKNNGEKCEKDNNCISNKCSLVEDQKYCTNEDFDKRGEYSTCNNVIKCILENNICTDLSDIDTTKGSVCMKKNKTLLEGCQYSIECADGLICDNGICNKDTHCSSAYDCHQNEICDLDLKTCLPTSDAPCNNMCADRKICTVLDPDLIDELFLYKLDKEMQIGNSEEVKMKGWKKIGKIQIENEHTNKFNNFERFKIESYYDEDNINLFVLDNTYGKLYYKNNEDLDINFEDYVEKISNALDINRKYLPFNKHEKFFELYPDPDNQSYDNEPDYIGLSNVINIKIIDEFLYIFTPNNKTRFRTNLYASQDFSREDIQAELLIIDLKKNTYKRISYDFVENGPKYTNVSNLCRDSGRSINEYHGVIMSSDFVKLGGLNINKKRKLKTSSIDSCGLEKYMGVKIEEDRSTVLYSKNCLVLIVFLVMHSTGLRLYYDIVDIEDIDKEKILTRIPFYENLDYINFTNTTHLHNIEQIYTNYKLKIINVDNNSYNDTESSLISFNYVLNKPYKDFPDENRFIFGRFNLNLEKLPNDDSIIFINNTNNVKEIPYIEYIELDHSVYFLEIIHDNESSVFNLKNVHLMTLTSFATTTLNNFLYKIIADSEGNIHLGEKISLHTHSNIVILSDGSGDKNQGQLLNSFKNQPHGLLYLDNATC